MLSWCISKRCEDVSHWPCHVKPLCMAKHACALVMLCLHCPMHHRIAASESMHHRIAFVRRAIFLEAHHLQPLSWSSWLCLGLCGRLLQYHDRLSHCKILNFVIDCRITATEAMCQEALSDSFSFCQCACSKKHTANIDELHREAMTTTTQKQQQRQQQHLLFHGLSLRAPTNVPNSCAPILA
jgi:hypothetical protein